MADLPAAPEPRQTGSQEHAALPQEITINAGTLGLITTVARVVAGLTTEKALTLFMAAAFSYLLYITMQQANADKANTARLYEENRERDRIHCSSREDKLARDFSGELEKMRLWYAGQSDSQRRFEADQRDRDRQAIAELTKVITKKFPNLNECPPNEE